MTVFAGSIILLMLYCGRVVLDILPWGEIFESRVQLVVMNGNIPSLSSPQNNITSHETLQQLLCCLV